MTDDVLHLEVWKGNWDLPTADHQCLTVWAYCKFSGLPTKVHKSHQLSFLQSSAVRYNLPVLQHGSETESQTGNILSYLKNQNMGIDRHRSNKELADITAFTALIEEKLLPAYLHQWWIDEDTYTEVTRPFYARAVPFPLNYVVPGKLQRQAKYQVYIPRTNDVIIETDVNDIIYKEAKMCLNHLSYRLGDKDFFFGDQPSSLDALVFGYVAPLLKATLPNSQLANHVKNCENLCKFCNRIMMQYFPISADDLEAKRKREEEQKEKAQIDSLEFPNKRRNMILAAIFALTSMIGYAFVSGLIRVVVQNNADYTESDFTVEVEDNDFIGGDDDDGDDDE